MQANRGWIAAVGLLVMRRASERRAVLAQPLRDPGVLGGDLRVIRRQGQGPLQQGLGLAEAVAGRGGVAALALQVGALAQEFALVAEGDDMVRCAAQGLVGGGDGVEPAASARAGSARVRCRSATDDRAWPLFMQALT